MLFLVSFEVAFGPRWLQWKAMEHKHNVTRYKSKYETLVIGHVRYISILTLLRGFQVKLLPYYMKFWRHFNLAILAIFQKIAKLKCTKIKGR